MRTMLTIAVLSIVTVTPLRAADEPAGKPWRPLPLITDGKVDPAWVHLGYGGFSVVDGSLRTDCDARGLGLLLYRKEHFGDCQIRVVYRSEDARDNAGVYVRIAPGILERLDEKPPAMKRNDDGELSPEMLELLMAASEKGLGPWYAVHHGYEVQICDDTDPYHRTGAIYSLAEAAAPPKKEPTEWKTMVITLRGNRVTVDIDGQRVTEFDPAAEGLPERTEWYEPDRKPERPESGYIGLQNHDPGDVVYFKEVSVRPLGEKPPADR